MKLSRTDILYNKNFNPEKNFDLHDLPYSGENPGVSIIFSIQDIPLEPINVILDRKAFPAGVENFYKLASGQSIKSKTVVLPTRTYNQYQVRNYDRSICFIKKYNNIIIGGDIYKNNGLSSASIYDDEAFPFEDPGFYYSHNQKGLLSLVPYLDQETGQLMYDSIFSMTLRDPDINNDILSLDESQVVIGKVSSGINVLNMINNALMPGQHKSQIIRVESMTPHRLFKREKPKI